MSYQIVVDVPDNTVAVSVIAFDEKNDETMRLNKLVSANGCTCGSKDDHHKVECYLGIDSKPSEAV